MKIQIHNLNTKTQIELNVYVNTFVFPFVIGLSLVIVLYHL